MLKQKGLKKLVRYNSDTGVFTSLVGVSNQGVAGSIEELMMYQRIDDSIGIGRAKYMKTKKKAPALTEALKKQQTFSNIITNNISHVNIQTQPDRFSGGISGQTATPVYSLIKVTNDNTDGAGCLAMGDVTR